ncbi:hypothetical protein IPL68_00980 [Candidatus Saccharibacteria bacterium]|nr:MAG: hypothetical protein IPL68_00980 [Candidatus Saccharibacteria bacterium]
MAHDDDADEFLGITFISTVITTQRLLFRNSLMRQNLQKRNNIRNERMMRLMKSKRSRKKLYG